MLRYRLAAGAIHAAGTWVDLGSGTAAAAADALGRDVRARIVLVDNDRSALQAAEREFERGVEAIEADLSGADGVERVRATLAGAVGGCVTCFETIEHLDDFGPVVELLLDLAQRQFAVFLSVPNDAFTGVENPYHVTVWGESALEELRGLLPPHVLLHQASLVGSCIGRAGEPARFQLDVSLGGGRVPSHFLLAFGAGVDSIDPLAAVAPLDHDADRAWQRTRENDLTFYRARFGAGDDVATRADAT